MSTSTPAFITGSRAYGTPREDSDIDLVILVDATVIDYLRHLSDPSPDGSLRFGRLNLIACPNHFSYEGWKKGTDELISKSLVQKVTRDDAIAVFKEIRKGVAEAEYNAQKSEANHERPT